MTENIIEENLIRCPSNSYESNVEATLKIPIDAKSDKEIKHILNAISELKEAGLKFDYGMGFGYFDIELDHTMKGMVLVKNECADVQPKTACEEEQK